MRDWTVQQVLDYVRERGRDSETLNFIYVVDEKRKVDRRLAHSRVPPAAARYAASIRSWTAITST